MPLNSKLENASIFSTGLTKKLKQDLALWKIFNAPEGKIHRYDVSVAKNYLSDGELKQMQRINGIHFNRLPTSVLIEV